MKRISCLIISVVLVLSLVGCAAKTAATPAATPTATPVTATEAPKSHYIGFSTLTTQGDFMAMLANQLQERFTGLGHKFEVASADLNPSKQIEQIENFITLGVNELIIMAVDPSSLNDVIKKAQSKGIKVVAFSQKTATYDLYLGADETANGKAVAQIAADWIDATFPDAAPESVGVAIFENRDKPTAAERSDNFKNITNLTKKAKIIKVVGVDTTSNGGQSAAENLMMTNKDIKVVICYNADTAMGVNAYSMALNSRVKDKAHFGAFSIDFNPAALDAIKKSANNESIWRGTVMMDKSIDDMLTNIVNKSLSALDGTLQSKDDYAKLYPITVSNIDSIGK